MLTPYVLSAQGRQVHRAPNELLAAFEREYQTSKGPTSPIGRDIAQVVSHPETYAASNLAVFVRGLEQIALKGSSSRIRASAVMNLALLGSRRKSHPVNGTVDRLRQIYQQTKDPSVRSMVVVGMADVANRAEAVRFLELIAVQNGEKSDFPGAPSRALGSLVAMDDEGRAALQRLHHTGAVRDPEARMELATLAKQGFRVP
jgi:hypothetical protein